MPGDGTGMDPDRDIDSERVQCIVSSSRVSPVATADPGRVDGDQTAFVSADLGIAHPYLLCDVEVLNRERACTIREALSSECRKLWTLEAKGDGAAIEPLPRVEAGSCPLSVRQCLRQHQERDSKLSIVTEQLFMHW